MYKQQVRGVFGIRRWPEKPLGVKNRDAPSLWREIT